MRIGCVGCVLLAMLSASCGTLPPARRSMPIGEQSAPPPAYSMIFIIHGDGDYLYHDTCGTAYRADEQALIAARSVAEHNPQAEVLIFHQRHRRHRLLFFPRRDGSAYFYRNGQLISTEAYWRGRGQSYFQPEVAIYHRYCAERPGTARLFLYFGHEIPEFDGTGYDASHRARKFTVNDLADGLERITGDSTKFDLIVLSTCFNGTPHTIAALAPYARTIVASPDNLHLSYFDLQPLERLDDGLRNGDMAAFSNAYARQAFARLAAMTQTAVTVAVYDVARVQRYIDTVDSNYRHAISILQRQKTVLGEHRDCADDSAYVRPGMGDGVDIYYRPARFGRSQHKQSHSGWECWKLPE